MSGTPTKPDLRVEDDERHSDEVDAYIKRNRKTLNRSLREARKAVARGEVSKKDFGAIVAEGRARRDQRS